MNESVRRWAGLSVIGLWLVGAVNALYAQDACLDARVTASDPGVFESFGYSVALSGDTAIVGAQWDSELGTEAGAAYIFRLDPDTSAWIEQQKLLASDGDGGEHFGRSVTIQGDTAMIAATSHLHNGATGNGSVYVFKYKGSTWVEQQEFFASDGAIGDVFGGSVSLSGDLAIIGARFDDEGGSAYVFRFDGSKWMEEQKLLASDGGGAFGISVDIRGDVAVVGADSHVNQGPTFGAAYVFRFDPDTSGWVQEQQLLPSSDAGGARFGSSVSISGDPPGRILIGARLEGSGSAYVFRFDPAGEPGSQWIEEQKLVPSGRAGTHQFGRAVALDGDTAVVGAWSWASYPGGPSIGRAYVFQFDPDGSGTWVEQQQLSPEPNAWTNFFGWSVAIDGETALIGAHGEDQQRGAAYVFDLSPNCNCPHDLDGDGSVGAADLLSLLVSWGPCQGCPADFDGNGTVGASDLLALLVNWGPCP